MATIDETASRYESVCKELGLEPSQYIKDVFDKEKKQSLV